MSQRSRWYKLDDDHNVVPCADLDEWARFYNDYDRVVKQEYVAGPDRKAYHVSTVFLGLDHRYFDEGPPIVFETMIFGLDHKGEYIERCATWAEALEMHERAKALVKAGGQWS